MQGKIKLNLQGKEIARNGNCKEWNLQDNRFASKNYIFYFTVNVSYLKINVANLKCFNHFECTVDFGRGKFYLKLMKFSILH